MAKRVIEHAFTGTTTPYTSYDPTKTNLGVLIQQRTGSNPTDKFAGPMPIGLGRPVEASTSIPIMYPHAIPYDSDNQWVFFVENLATAVANRRVVLYNYQISTSTYTWNGYVTLTLQSATAHTIRGFRVTRDLYTTGTAAVNGTAVTGTGTAWNSSNLPIGCRIGFGSTDPTQITTWYEISAIGSDTSITLTSSAGSVGDGAYVIEDLRLLLSCSNATLTNGGVFMAKGLRFELFSPSGTTIASSSATDGVRATYWLADASTVTNTISCGLALDTKTSWTSHNIYVLDGTAATNRVYVFNIRATLTLASGKSTSAFQYVTGAQTPTGTVSQANNGRIGILNHGPGVGVKCLYFVTTTRVYRAIVSNITNGNTSWQQDAMVEVPPGGTSTYAATSALSSCEISDGIDRLIIMSTGASGVRSYASQYNTSSNPFDHIFLCDDKQLDQSSADSGAVAHPSIQVGVFSVWSEGGILHLCRNLTTAAGAQIYSLPIGAHWTYAGTAPVQRLITPSLDTSNATSLDRVYVNAARQLGSGTTGLSTEPFRIYYRTSGISDDSGSWTLVDDSGVFTDSTPSSAIQLMFEFKIFGMSCIPARIYSASVVYEDNTTDSHYQPSVGQSNTSSKYFAWRFSTAFGGTVPTLRVELYDAVAGTLLMSDVTDSPTGTWEKSTNDGGSWGAYDTSDKANETTYIRYPPASLADNIKVRALLIQD
ncbi:MAG TPA: hypothetical protein PK295_04435, partial [Candidatus Magasanikbacteria bacterium]|nr:hypothetical protein [Candidatus Magasanikbacteria bacterium]